MNTLIEVLSQNGSLEKSSVIEWVEQLNINEADIKMLLNCEWNVIFNYVLSKIAVSESLLKKMPVNTKLLRYWEASPDDVKSLSEADFNLIANQGDGLEKTNYFAYLVLRHSSRKADFDYVSKLGWISNHARIRSQAYGGKLYKMAAPYLLEGAA